MVDIRHLLESDLDGVCRHTGPGKIKAAINAGSYSQIKTKIDGERLRRTSPLDGAQVHYRHERGATRRALVRCVMKTGLLSAEVTGQNPSEIPGGRADWHLECWLQ